MVDNIQRPILGVSVALFHEDKVLLVQRGKNPGKGQWSLPGGKVEIGETVQAAAVREVFEETGVVVEIGPLIGLYEIIAPPVHYVIACYMGNAQQFDLNVGSDAAAADYFEISDIEKLTLAPNVINAINDAERFSPMKFNFKQSR